MSLDQVAIRILNSVVAIAQVSPDRAQGCENRQENDDKFLHTVIPDFVSQKKEPHDETHHAALQMALISYDMPSVASVGSSIVDVTANPLSAWKSAMAC